MPTVNGTTYHDATDPRIIAVLESCRTAMPRTRIRLSYGDPATGLDSLDTSSVEGYVGRSSGQVKCPILVRSQRARGGGEIPTRIVVRITTTTAPRRVLYAHPAYHTGVVTVDDAGEVRVDGVVTARFADRTKAVRWVARNGWTITEDSRRE